jgi:hypothetical protein
MNLSVSVHPSMHHPHFYFPCDPCSIKARWENSSSQSLLCLIFNEKRSEFYSGPKLMWALKRNAVNGTLIFGKQTQPQYVRNYNKLCHRLKIVLTPCQIYLKINLKNSVALVCERTIPTERPPLVGEVSTNFCG